MRAVPNSFLRSALFGAIAKGSRRYIDGEDLAVVDGMTVRYKGERLDQGDLDVWASVLHMARLKDLGSNCRFKSYRLLKLMGRTDTGKNRDTLEKRIERLVGATVTVRQGRQTYIATLIRSATKDKQTREWLIELNETLSPLFAWDQFTQVDWGVRNALAGHQLAQWLHGFYASHARPFPLKVETLHRLSGSEATSLSDYLKTLRKALDAVAKASEIVGTGFCYQIHGDLVHVDKAASNAQRRHLAKKAGKAQKSRGSYRSSNPAMPFQQPHDAVAATQTTVPATKAEPFQQPRNAVPATQLSTG